MKKIFLFLLLLFYLSAQSYSQDAEYRQAVLDMMEISNTLDNFRIVITLMID
ncbi:MAG: hypothetical protein AAGC85_24080 [Bacteroidota bacterium]